LVEIAILAFSHSAQLENEIGKFIKALLRLLGKGRAGEDK
jgi:hypothetical protein